MKNRWRIKDVKNSRNCGYTLSICIHISAVFPLIAVVAAIFGVISLITGFFGTIAVSWDPASPGLPDPAYVANTTLQWAEYIAKNDVHGYNEGFFSRWGSTDYSNVTFVVTAYGSYVSYASFMSDEFENNFATRSKRLAVARSVYNDRSRYP